jgi:Amt family ammonium transporter
MKLRLPDEVLEIGDVAVHGEEAYPSDELVSTTAALVADETPAKNEKVPEMATSGSADHT